MVDATVRLFEEKRGERAQICSLQSSEKSTSQESLSTFASFPLASTVFSFLFSLFYFFRGKDFIFFSFFVLDLEKKKRERERESE